MDDNPEIFREVSLTCPIWMEKQRQTYHWHWGLQASSLNNQGNWEELMPYWTRLIAIPTYCCISNSSSRSYLEKVRPLPHGLQNSTFGNVFLTQRYLWDHLVRELGIASGPSHLFRCSCCSASTIQDSVGAQRLVTTWKTSGSAWGIVRY